MACIECSGSDDDADCYCDRHEVNSVSCGVKIPENVDDAVEQFQNDPVTNEVIRAIVERENIRRGNEQPRYEYQMLGFMVAARGEWVEIERSLVMGQ